MHAQILFSDKKNCYIQKSLQEANRKIFSYIFGESGKTIYMKISFKKIINIILYNTPKQQYDFSLPKDTSKSSSFESIPNIISTSLETNLNNLKLRYTASINSDIILRKFKLKLNNKIYDALIVCIDGMIDSNLVNDFLLKPLMQTNSVASKSLNINGVRITKKVKLDLKQYIHDTLIFQNDVNDAKTLDDIIMRRKLW